MQTPPQKAMHACYSGAPDVSICAILRVQQSGKNVTNRAFVAVQQVSERVLATDAPVIVKTKQLMAGASGVLSLAQGVSLMRTAICT